MDTIALPSVAVRQSTTYGDAMCLNGAVDINVLD